MQNNNNNHQSINSAIRKRKEQRKHDEMKNVCTCGICYGNN